MAMPLRFSPGSTFFLLAAASTAAALGASCGGGTATTGGGGTTQATHTTSGTGTGIGGDIGLLDASTTGADFPAAPVIADPMLPANIGDLFAAGEQPTGGPCVAEPAMDAMIPRNWTPLFFEWSAPSGQNVFEIKIVVDNQVNPLVVYTTGSTFTVDAAMWAGLTAHSAGHDLEITVRGAVLDNGALTAPPAVGTAGKVHLAPVDAAGSVVYWTASGGTSFKGFTIGDTTSKLVLTPGTAGPTSSGGNTNCVSCHASTPDGKYVVYSRDGDDGSRAIDVRKVTGGAPDPADISPAALQLLGRTRQTAPVMSAAHYSATDAVVIASFLQAGGARYELSWTDLHAADANGWGVLARDGDPRNAFSPSWRRDGAAVAYVSAAAGGEGVIAAPSPGDPTMDIYTVPYNNRAGGPATPLAGASDPNYHEFYPVYSPDDALLAFNRTDTSVANSYNQAPTEVFVTPGGGGTATRLKANDPPACTGFVSPGLTNSWARWAPRAETYGGKTYHWLVFSSKRRAAAHDAAGNLRPQLYISAVVMGPVGPDQGIVAEYPAVYVTAQSPDDNNHTPAWDVFDVQSIPPQ